MESDSETVKSDPPQLTFFDPSDAIGNMLKGKPAYLIFHVDTVHQESVSNIMPTTTDPHLSKALPGKIDCERKDYHHILLSDHMMSYSTLYGKLRN